MNKNLRTIHGAMLTVNCNLRKKIVLTTIAAIMVCAVFFLFTPIVRAGLLEDAVMSSMEDTVGSWFFLSFVQTIKEVMFDTNYIYNVTDNSSIATVMMNNMAAAAVSIYVVFVIIKLIQETLNGRATLDMFLRVFVKMAVTLFAVTNCNIITNTIHNVMNSLIIAGTTALWNVDSSMTFHMLSTTASSGWIMTLVALILLRIVLTVLGLLVLAYVKIVSYSFLIELNIRKMFMPFAILSLMDEGGATLGYRYIKKYMAIYLRMFMYVIAFGLADIITSTSMLQIEESANHIVGSGAVTLKDDIINVAADVYGMVMTIFVYGLQWIILQFSAIACAKKSEMLCYEIIGV